MLACVVLVLLVDAGAIAKHSHGGGVSPVRLEGKLPHACLHALFKHRIEERSVFVLLSLPIWSAKCPATSNFVKLVLSSIQTFCLCVDTPHCLSIPRGNDSASSSLRTFVLNAQDNIRYLLILDWPARARHDHPARGRRPGSSAGSCRLEGPIVPPSELSSCFPTNLKSYSSRPSLDVRCHAA